MSPMSRPQISPKLREGSFKLREGSFKAKRKEIVIGELGEGGASVASPGRDVEGGGLAVPERVSRA